MHGMCCLDTPSILACEQNHQQSKGQTLAGAKNAGVVVDWGFQGRDNSACCSRYLLATETGLRRMGRCHEWQWLRSRSIPMNSSMPLLNVHTPLF